MGMGMYVCGFLHVSVYMHFVACMCVGVCLCVLGCVWVYAYVYWYVYWVVYDYMYVCFYVYPFVGLCVYGFWSSIAMESKP